MRMKILLLAGITLFSTLLFGQNKETHRWKKVDNPAGKKIWYDVSTLDTLKGSKFAVWVLEVHTPPLKFPGLDGEVYRTKTLYAVNLTTVRYGIVKIRYYDVKNKLLYSFDYDTPPPPTDAIKYPYPVLENSDVHLIIKELFGNNYGKQN